MLYYSKSFLYSHESQDAHRWFQIFQWLEAEFWVHSNSDHPVRSARWTFLTIATKAIVLSPVLVLWAVKKHFPGPRAGVHILRTSLSCYQLWCWHVVFWISKSPLWVFYLPHCKMDMTFISPGWQGFGVIFYSRWGFRDLQSTLQADSTSLKTEHTLGV